MNILRVKTKIQCATCGSVLKRTKSIRVNATDQEIARLEAQKKIDHWRKSLKDQNCKICQSIIEES